MLRDFKNSTYNKYDLYLCWHPVVGQVETGATYTQGSTGYTTLFIWKKPQKEDKQIRHHIECIDFYLVYFYYQLR